MTDSEVPQGKQEGPFVGAFKRENGEIVAVLTPDGWKPAKHADVKEWPKQSQGEVIDLVGSDLSLVEAFKNPPSNGGGSQDSIDDYIKDMFLMVWRDATIGLGADKHVVCNSAIAMVMKRVEAWHNTQLKAAIPEKKQVWNTDKSVDSLYEIQGYNQAVTDMERNLAKQ